MKLYLHREDIEDLNQVSRTTALTIMKEIRTTYNLGKGRAISIKAYCDYFMLDKEDVWVKLNELKNKKAS